MIDWALDFASSLILKLSRAVSLMMVLITFSTVVSLNLENWVSHNNQDLLFNIYLSRYTIDPVLPHIL